jgi:hypothetical protein
VRSAGPDADDALVTFALGWLRRNVPDGLATTTLVHGDAGVGNFLYVGDRVTSVLDWEWAHLGDPMEDLAAVNIHGSFFPSGSMAANLERYAAAGGAPVGLDRIRFFRVENMLRSVVVLRAITARLDVRDPVALNLAYRLLCERFLGECLADAIAVAPDDVHLPDPPPDAASMHDLVAEVLRDVVAPAVADGWARDQVGAMARLVAHLGRRERLGPACDELECDDLADVLGHRPADVASGRAALAAVIPTWAGERDQSVIRYLVARSRREETVAAPLMTALPTVRLQPLDR